MFDLSEWARWRAQADRPSLPTALLAADYLTRVKAALALARRASEGDSDAEATLDLLSRGDTHARRIAARSLFTHAPSERLLRLAGDASGFVWGAASKALAARGAADDVYTGVLTAWTMRRHTRLLGWLQSASRHSEIGRFVRWMAERGGSPEWVDWLPASDEATLQALLPAALERPSARFWSRLARVQPAVLVRVAQSALSARPGAPDGQLRVVLQQNLLACARTAPDLTLALVSTLHDRGAPVGPDVWRALVDRRPNEALTAWWALGHTWSTALRDVELLTTDTLVNLLEGARAPLPEPKEWIKDRAPADRARIVAAWAWALPHHPRQTPSMFRWFESPDRDGRGAEPTGEPAPAPLPGDTRLALWQAWSVANRNADGILPYELAGLLPPDLARREALRHLHEVAALTTRPLERMAWMGLLAYEDVEPLIRPYLGHPEPETRGPAVATLIRVCGRDASRSELATIGLQLVLDRKFEQDPVRGRMFQALVAWPKTLWRADHLPLLSRALRDALDAADLSRQTAQPMERVLLDRFALDPAWAAGELGTFLKERGSISEVRFAARLSDAELDAALPALNRIGRTWRAQERWPMVTDLCHGLGHRLPRAPELAALLVDIATTCPHEYYAVVPWKLLFDHAPAIASAHRVAVATVWVRRGWRRPFLDLVEARDPSLVRAALEAHAPTSAAAPSPRRWSVAERAKAVEEAGEPHAHALVPLLEAVTWSAKPTERWIAIRALRQIQRTGAPVFQTMIANIAGAWPVEDLAAVAVALGPVVAPGVARDLPPATGGGTPSSPHTRSARRARGYVPDVLAAAIVKGCTSGDASRVASALSALRRPQCALFAEAATAVLAVDASAIALDLIRAWAHRYAQPLLTPALGGTVVTGRWSTGRTSWLFQFGTGQFRWEPGMQARWATSADREITNADRDSPTRLALLTELPELAWIPSPLPRYADDTTPESLGRSAPGFSAVEPGFASAAARSAVDVSTEAGIRGVESARFAPVIRERATRLLGRVDAGGGVPALLACLADDRARWAIYSLRRGLRSLPPDSAATLLLQAPRRQVTVAKEILRLLGELRGEAGFRALIGLSSTKLHRDVRIALLRALWDHLDRDETWSIYTEAADGPDHVLASRLGDVPADRLTREADRRLSALYARVVARPEPEARIDALRRAPSLAIRDPERALFQACFARLDTIYVDELAAAVHAVTARIEAADEAHVAATLPRLAENRRALVALLTRWRSLFPTQASRSLRTVFAAGLDALLSDPQLTGEVVGDSVLFGIDRFVATVERVLGAGHFNPLALMRSRSVVTQLERKDAEALLRRWSAHPDVRLRLLAFAALEREAGLAGWSVATREALAVFQRDPDAMVAGAARLVFPPEELPPP